MQLTGFTEFRMPFGQIVLSATSIDDGAGAYPKGDRQSDTPGDSLCNRSSFFL